MRKEELEKRIQKKITEIDAVADQLPGVVIIHRIPDFTVEYMSRRGLQNLGMSLQQLKDMGMEYHRKFFNPEDSADYVPKIAGLLERNDDQELISFFQQVRRHEDDEYEWHTSTIRILMKGVDGKTLLTITMAFPIDPLHHNTTKVSRLLEENNFLRNNHQKFSSLSEREREVLACLALGKTSPEIAKKLFISIATADTHRRNIKRKLKVSSQYDLSLYARAFDLI